MLVSMIVAMDRNRVIGLENGIPWRLPDDMAWFKHMTMGKAVIMGRKTYESIPLRFRPLPGRLNIVATKNPEYKVAGGEVVHSVEAALVAARGYDEVMVAGGEALYKAFLPRAQRLYLTLIEASVMGDTVFPPFDMSLWREVSREVHEADERHAYRFTWLILARDGKELR